LPSLLLLTDEARLADPRGAIARLPRGAGVILRHYAAVNRVVLARELAALCRRRGLLFLVAGDAALARRVGADGLHLPEHALRRRLPARNARWIVTAAAHSLPAILKAQAMGVDAALVSPIFLTASHPSAPALGPRRLAGWTRIAGISIYALGGVNAETVRRLKGIDLAGVAAIGGLAP
jgi:thiamine-phosphate pyrophosphorylase